MVRGGGDGLVRDGIMDIVSGPFYYLVGLHRRSYRRPHLQSKRPILQNGLLV